MAFKVNEYLSALQGQLVTVKTNSGAEYKGLLIALDGYMNVSLKNIEE
jgi:small nuclear ribonucleoprotein (snRNP)-like protein